MSDLERQLRAYAIVLDQASLRHSEQVAETATGADPRALHRLRRRSRVAVLAGSVAVVVALGLVLSLVLLPGPGKLNKLSSKPTTAPSVSGCPTPAAEVVAFDDSGSRRWTVPLEPSGDPQATALVANGGLVFADSGVRVTAIDEADGSVRWSRSVGQPIDQQWMIGGVLVISEGRFAKSVLTGLDPADGRILWSWRPPGHFLDRGLQTDDGGLVLAIANPSELLVLDARTGRLRWSVPTAPGEDVNLPAVGGGLVLLYDSGSLSAYDDRTGRRVWRQPYPDSGGVKPVISGNIVATAAQGSGGRSDSAPFEAFRLSTGERTWRSPYAADLGDVWPVAGGFVVYPRQTTSAQPKAPAQVMFIDAESGAVRWKYGEPGRSGYPEGGSPLHLGGDIAVLFRVYKSQPSTVVIFDAKSGNVVSATATTAYTTFLVAGPSGKAFATGNNAPGRDVLEELHGGRSVWRVKLALPAQSSPLVSSGGVVVQLAQPPCLHDA